MPRTFVYSGYLLLVLCGLISNGCIANALSAGSSHPPAQGNSAQTKQPGHKRALLVGISNYCRVKGNSCRAHDSFWWNLNTKPDIEGLESVLRNRYEFDEIITLTDTQATHQNIIEKFNELTGKTAAGDVFFFHFSGHGSQVPDDDKNGPNPVVGDELDRYDETLIPYDYVSRRDGSKDIRDDEIGQLIDKLKQKKPANVTLTFDSCHSGTIQRGGESVIRGGEWLGAKPIPSNNNTITDDSPTSFFSPDEARRKGFVVITAARHDQLANETPGPKAMGVFSAALIKALDRASENVDTTYRDVFEVISDEVNRKFREQSPQLEGALDNKLMSGIVRNPSPYFPVNLSTDGKALVLRAGELMGITKDSKFSIYETGTDSKIGQPLARAVVGVVNPTTSVLDVEGGLLDVLKEKLKTARALETKHAYGDIRLKVLNWNLKPNEKAAELRATLKARDLLQLQDKARNGYDIRLCQGHCPDEVPDSRAIPIGDFITLQRSSGGGIIARVPVGENQTTDILAALEGETRWRLIKQLQGNDPTLQVRLRLVPVRVLETNAEGLVTKTEDLAPEALRKGGRLEFQEGETFMLEMQNLSRQAVWVSVLNLNNAGNIKPMWPHPKISVGNSDENKIPPAVRDEKGRWVWWRVPYPYVIVISGPFGHELFKVIATSKPANLSPLFYDETIEDIRRGGRRGRAKGTEEAQTSLGQFLMTVASGETRQTRSGEIVGLTRSDRVEVEIDGFTTWSIDFESKSKQSIEAKPQASDKTRPQRP